MPSPTVPTARSAAEARKWKEEVNKNLWRVDGDIASRRFGDPQELGSRLGAEDTRASCSVPGARAETPARAALAAPTPKG
jgi:hypothetical protein